MVVVTGLMLIRVFIFNSSIEIMLIEVRSWCVIGFNSSISILGFLLAGFLIFATLSKPRMLVEMMNHIHKESNLPYLKYNFFVFMRVFIFYIFFIFIYLIVILFGSHDGLYECFLKLFTHYEFYREISIKIANIIVGSSFVFL